VTNTLENLERLFSRAQTDAENGSPPSEELLTELANALEDLARHLESKDLTISQEQFKTRIEALSIQAAELEKKFFSQSQSLDSFIQKTLANDEKSEDVYKKPNKSKP
jgi:hypothetical protein